MFLWMVLSPVLFLSGCNLQIGVDPFSVSVAPFLGVDPVYDSCRPVKRIAVGGTDTTTNRGHEHTTGQRTLVK